MKYIFILLIILGVVTTNAQDPTRFNKQVEQLLEKEYSFDDNKELVVFTGSSSIVRWKTVPDDFPKYNVINNGFGGSVFSDLIYFYEELILNQKADILFIYEGDNDVGRGKKIKMILNEAKALHTKIKTDLPACKVIFIAPKPSLQNWDKKDDYIKLNKKLQKYCNKQDQLEFADVWSAMVDENGVVFQDIFVEDGNHMNEKGYDIWREVIGEFMK
jgi:lysophospholipase L1-like esterase